MLTKEKVKKAIDRLPDKFTVDQIIEELVVLKLSIIRLRNSERHF